MRIFVKQNLMPMQTSTNATRVPIVRQVNHLVDAHERRKGADDSRPLGSYGEKLDSHLSRPECV